MPTHLSTSIIAPRQIEPATIDDLKGRELFEGAREESLRMLEGNSFICMLQAHERLHLTRDGVDYIYIILSGYVGIWLASRFLKKRENFLAWRGPEQVIGEMRSIGSAQTEARITACETCQFIEMRSDIFTIAADSTALIYRNLSRLLMKKMYQERHRSEVIQTPTVRRKVAQTLLHLAMERCSNQQKETNKVIIPGAVIQDEIGAYIGSNRETVSRKLHDFKEEQIISYAGSKKGSEIIILDQEKLEMIARNLR